MYISSNHQTFHNINKQNVWNAHYYILNDHLCKLVFNELDLLPIKPTLVAPTSILTPSHFHFYHIFFFTLHCVANK